MRSVNAHKVTFLGFLIFSLITVSASALGQTTTRPKTTSSATTSYRYAYQYGYRAGYDDGLTKGKSDFNENEPRDFSASEAYKNADRGYSERYGTLAEYQEGYRIGFELGYNDGYLGRTSSSTTLPTNLGKVVIATVNASSSGDVAPEPSRPPLTGASSTTQGTRQPSGSQGGTIIVRDGVQMKIRLTTEINTKTNRQGDRFTAIVLDPSEYADAVVEGFIAKLNKSGSASGKTELSLAFSSIRMRDGRTGKLAAQVERVYESEKVKSIDEEGNVQTGSRSKDTIMRGGGGAALGAIIGGIAGGGKGAAIGAAIGGGVGVGSVFIEGGKEMVLEPGTEILIRTAAAAKEGN